MQVRDRRTGQMVELPDEYDDDQILGHFSAQGQQAPSLAQSFIGGIQQQAGSQIAQQLAQGPAQSTLPNIGGGAMVGLTPQQAQFTLQSAQNSNVDAMQQKMEQQRQTQQSLESEKDRSQQLKLHKENLKNIIAERKIQADRDKFEAEVRAEEGKLNRELQERLATLDETFRRDSLKQSGEQFDKGYNLDEKAQGFEERRVAVAEAGLGLDQKEMEADGWQTNNVMRDNPETGQKEVWLAYTKPGLMPEYISPAPPNGKPLDVVDRPDHPKVYEFAQENLKMSIQDNEAAPPEFKKKMSELQNEAIVSARLGYNVTPFVSQRELDMFIESDRKSQLLYIKNERIAETGDDDYQLTPEDMAQAESEAKRSVLNMAGFKEGKDGDYQMVNGKPIFNSKTAPAAAPSPAPAPTNIPPHLQNPVLPPTPGVYPGYTPPQAADWFTMTQGAGKQ